MDFRDFAATFPDANICSKTIIKSMEFECILLNLRRLLNFVQSNTQEMCFVNMREDYLPFYYMIIVDTVNLKSDLFTDECKVVANEILNTLDMKKGVFSWEISIGRRLKTGLSVFLKKQNVKPYVYHFSERFNKPIREAFKEIWVKSTLKFLKSSRLTLRYPNMPNKEAYYLYNAILKQDEEAVLGLLSLWNPVWEAMNIFKLRYEFIVSLCNADLGFLLFVNFEKIKKRIKASTIENMKISISNVAPSLQRECDDTQSINKGVQMLNISSQNTDDEVNKTSNYDDCINSDINKPKIQDVKDAKINESIDKDPNLNQEKTIPHSRNPQVINKVNMAVEDNKNSCSNQELDEHCKESHVTDIIPNEELTNRKDFDLYKCDQGANDAELMQNIDSDINMHIDVPLINMGNEVTNVENEIAKEFEGTYSKIEANIRAFNSESAQAIEDVTRNIESIGIRNEVQSTPKGQSSLDINKDMNQPCNALNPIALEYSDVKYEAEVYPINDIDKNVNQLDDSNSTDTPNKTKSKQMDNQIIINATTEIDTDNQVDDSNDGLNIKETKEIRNEIIANPTMEIDASVNEFDNSNTIDVTNINETEVMNEIIIKHTIEIDTDVIQLDDSTIDQLVIKPTMEINKDVNQLDDNAEDVGNINKIIQIRNQVMVKSTIELDESNTTDITNLNINNCDNINIIKVQPSIETDTDVNQLDNNITDTNTTEIITNEYKVDNCDNVMLKVQSTFEIDNDVNQLDDNTTNTNKTEIVMNEDMNFKELNTKNQSQHSNSIDNDKYALTDEELELKEATKRNPSSTRSIKLLSLKRKLVDSVSKTFLIKSLKTIIDFVKDDLSATLEIKDLRTSEMYFLLRLGALNPLAASADVFDDDCLNLIVKLFYALDHEEHFRIVGHAAKPNKHEKKKRYQIVLENMDNADYRGTVIFGKYPHLTNKNKHKKKSRQNNKKAENEKIKTENIDNVEKITETKEKDDCTHNENEFKFNFQVELDDGNEKYECVRENNVYEVRRKTEEEYFLDKNMNDIDEDLEELRKPKSILEKMIQASEISTEKARGTPENSRKILDQRTSSVKGKHSDHMREMKHKLIEGLAVPIESDKAMRMMRLMGWQGGALGVRGEGLIEPIQPQLDVPSRVGLGHRKHESSKQHINRLQQRILNRRADFTQNEEYFEETDSIEDETCFKKPSKAQKRKDKTKKQQRKANKKEREKNKNKDVFERPDDFTIKRKRKIDLSKVKDICLNVNNNERRENLNIDLSLEKSRNYNNLHEANGNSNELQKAKVVDLKGFGSVLKLKQMNTYIDTNNHSDKQCIEKLSDDSAIQISDETSNQSLSNKPIENYLQTDEEVIASDDRKVIIDDSDVQMIDDTFNLSDTIHVDNNCVQMYKDIRVSNDKIEVIDDCDNVQNVDASYQSDQIKLNDGCVQGNNKGGKVGVDAVLVVSDCDNDLQNIDHVSNQEQIQVNNNCIQENDKAVSVVANNVMISEDGCDIQDIDSVSNSDEHINVNCVQTSDKRKSDDGCPLMIDNVQVDIFSNKKDQIEVNTNAQMNYEEDNNVTNQTDQIEINTQDQNNYESDGDDNDKYDNNVYVPKDGNYNEEYAQNIIEVSKQSQKAQDNINFALTDGVKIILNERFQRMIDNVDMNSKYISDIIKQVELMQVNTCVQNNNGVNADDDNDKNSESIDKVDNIEHIQVNINGVQIDDKEVIIYKFVEDNSDRITQSIDIGKHVQVNTNSLQVYDKGSIIDKYVVDDSFKDFQSIAQVHNSIHLNTNSVRINDKEEIIDKYVIDANDNNSQSIDKVDCNMQIQLYTNCLQINDKEAINDKYVIDDSDNELIAENKNMQHDHFQNIDNVIYDNDKDFQSIDKVDYRMQMQINTNCVQIYDQEEFTDDTFIVDVNDEDFQSIDRFDNSMQIHISDELLAHSENIIIGDNDYFQKDTASYNGVLQITSNVHDTNDKDIDNEDNSKNNNISDEGYENYELDINVKKASNRLALLVNILELVQNEYRFTVVRFPFKLSKKFESYITSTISSLNEREFVDFDNEREHMLIKAIAREMAAHSEMQLLCELQRVYRKQIASIIKTYDNRPINGPFYEDNHFNTTHSIPDYRVYDGMPLNTKVETGYHKLANRLIRDFIKSDDLERVYEFNSQVEVKTYINAVVGMLNRNVVTVNLGLGDVEYGVFCEAASAMGDVFLIARYDCPYIIFEKLQLVKVHPKKRCYVCEKGIKSIPITSNNYENVHEDTMNNAIDDKINSNDENISVNSAFEELQNISEVKKMDKNYFERDESNNCEINVQTFKSTETSKNVDYFDNIKCDSAISENIENMTLLQNKSNTDISNEGSITDNNNSETLVNAYDNTMNFLSQNEEYMNIETNKLLGKPEVSSNKEIDTNKSNEEVFDRLNYTNQSKDECMYPYFNSSNNDNTFDEEGYVEFLDIEDLKYNDNIHNENKLSVNTIRNQKQNKNTVNKKNIVESIEDISGNKEIETIEETSRNMYPVISTTASKNVWPKNVIIMHKNIKHKMDVNTAMQIQSIIYSVIKTTDDLPKIKFCGIKNDGVIYSCYDDKSYHWLIDTISVYYKIIDFEPDFKSRNIIELRINTFIKIDISLILSNIKKSYTLNTEAWKVIQERFSPEYCIFRIEIDDNSLKVIKKEQFSLFVGFDRADVSVVHNLD